MSDIAVQTRRLCRRYDDGRVQAIEDVNLSVARGEFVGIVGPSGCGKTTLLNLIGTLDAPTSGDVLFDGRQLKRREHAKFRSCNIGFVFQSYYLLPALDVLENVIAPFVPDFWRRGMSRKIEDAKQLLGLLGLENRMRHNVRDLSGGERQRVAIARALINNPNLILADEPTGNLDSENGRKILETFKTMHQQDEKTIIMVTHDENIRHYAGRIIAMLDGRIDEGKK
ncbi:MAG: ABC transporter ATP-binding protein [Lentisphaerae bacterium]|nr:ABC transporter ATP-binding protein [Lentisphaerota bacterium]